MLEWKGMVGIGAKKKSGFEDTDLLENDEREKLWLG
jgi:hypothetical protein